MEEAQRDDMIEQGAQGGDENTTSSCAGCKLPSCEIFLCCCNAQNTEKNGCNPVCTVSRSKIEFGNFKVSFGSAVDYETFPGQEYMCTEKAKETYLCEKLIFWGKL